MYICETCNKEIELDFRLPPYRDKDNKQILYGINTEERGHLVAHYFCCPEHINKELVVDGNC